jgi:integrase
LGRPDRSGGETCLGFRKVRLRSNNLMDALSRDSHHPSDLSYSHEVLRHLVDHAPVLDGRQASVYFTIDKQWPRQRANAPGPGRNLVRRSDTVRVPLQTDKLFEVGTRRAMSPTRCSELVRCSVEFLALREQSAKRLGGLCSHFARYVEGGHDCFSLTDVSPDLVRAFLHAPSASGDGGAPSVATMHVRRSAVRLLFRLARHLDLVDSDPTLDLVLPPRSSVRQRPLTIDEVIVCRSFSLQTLTETRQPAAWAVAEAAARSAEIPMIRASHIDLEGGTVFIPGGTRSEPRRAPLTEWGLVQLRRRLVTLETIPGDPPIIYSGRGGPESAQASSCAAIASVLIRAGLGREPDVGAGSVAAWAGAEARQHGMPIHYVAHMLGLRSLDRAASIIGWDWRAEEP